MISNYRPVSNFSFLPKNLEKDISFQLSNFLLSNNFFPSLPYLALDPPTTETCLLKVSYDALLASDFSKLSLLLSLDFSSAFDTFDHSLYFSISTLFLIFLTSHFLGLLPIFLTVLPLFLLTLLFLLSLFLLVFHRNLFSDFFFLFSISVISLVLSNLSLFKVSFSLMTPRSSLFFLFLPFLLLLKGLAFVLVLSFLE